MNHPGMGRRFPFVLVSHSYLRVPVVPDIPVNRQLVEDAAHGFHVRVNDLDSIASALVRLLAEPEPRSRIGALARQRVVEHCSVDKVADRYEALFQAALAANGRPPA